MIASGPTLSGNRFTVWYHLTGTESEARATATDICREQTVEVPEEAIPAGVIRDEVVGRLEEFRRLPSGSFEAAISFAVETAGAELTQLLNVTFGNSSLKPGIRVVHLDLPDNGFAWLKGPRFGREGLRARLGVPDRPLLCTALKPMGLSAKELADLAYQMALGGIDIIKDDHGLTDQSFAPFEDRVPRCADALERANRETGRRCVYMPNVTAPAGVCLQRGLFAKQAGAGGVLICPGLTGWDAIRQIAEEDGIDLPILVHPAFLGSFLTDRHSGMSHQMLLGQLPRLAGADASIFPSFGGRFSFSPDECRSIAQGTGEEMGHFKPIFPTPGGGMTLDRVPELCEFYGHQVIFLIGGGLYGQGPDLIENCKRFQRLVSQALTIYPS
jgi:ribulose-bisphosphate carboxylase large chain